MTATAIAAPTVRRRAASLSRDRRWALIVSYAFLILFAIFFLLPFTRDIFELPITKWWAYVVGAIAIGLGLTLTPLFSLMKFDLALLLGGVAAGTIAYGVHRMWGGR